MSDNQRIKPVIILPKGEMTKRDIKKLTDNGIVVVEANDPSLVRFADPPPEGYGIQEQAAIELFRTLMAKSSFMISRTNFAEMYADIVIRGVIPQRVAQVPKIAKQESRLR